MKFQSPRKQTQLASSKPVTTLVAALAVVFSGAFSSATDAQTQSAGGTARAGSGAQLPAGWAVAPSTLR